MEKSRNGTKEAAVLLVDEGIEDAAQPGIFVRDDVVVGNGSRDETGVSGLEGDFLARLAQTDAALALHAHGDNEGVVLDKVAMDRLVHLIDAHGEEGSVNHQAGSVLAGGIEGSILVLDGVVKGL